MAQNYKARAAAFFSFKGNGQMFAYMISHVTAMTQKEDIQSEIGRGQERSWSSDGFPDEPGRRTFCQLHPR